MTGDASIRLAVAALLAVGALGILRGSLAESTGCADSLCTLVARGSIPRLGSIPPIPDYIPDAQPGLSIMLAPGETVRALTRDQWRAIRDAFPAEQEYTAARTGWCEGHLDPATAIIDVDGLPRYGAWQVGLEWWGPVPDNLAGQAHQVAGIVAEYGWTPFTGARGCKEWNR